MKVQIKTYFLLLIRHFLKLRECQLHFSSFEYVQSLIIWNIKLHHIARMNN